MNRRQELIAEVKTWDATYRQDGEPFLKGNRFSDEMIDHLESLSDNEIEAIDDIYLYDYKGDL